MLKWLKVLFGGKAGVIKLLDEFEAPLAAKIKEGQRRAAEIPPDQFAKELVDEVQLKLCRMWGVDPSKVGL